MERQLKQIGLGMAVIGGLLCVSWRAAFAVPVDTVPGIYKTLTTAPVQSPTPIKPQQTTSFDILLKPTSLTAINHFAMAVNQVGTPEFKHYLTPTEFGRKFGSSQSNSHWWQSLLQRHGLHAQVFKNRLMIKVIGRVSRIQRLFRVNLNRARYHANPVQFGPRAPKIPEKLRRSVWTIIGLTEHNPGYLSIDTSLPFIHRSQRNLKACQLGFTSRFTKHYHVTPLYNRGLTGKGQAVGIIAFEGLTSTNVFHFWQHENVSISADRLAVQNVTSPKYWDEKGGTNSDETTMDAEYAESIAPEALVHIYLVNSLDPTLTNFVDAYEQCFNDNIVSSTSNSWGLMDSGQATILNHRRLLTPNYRQVLSLMWAQGAAQGISNFIASGDSGANNYAIKTCNRKSALLDHSLATSDPSDTNPWLTSVGGTTLPFKIKGNGITVVNKRERAWGMDYLWPLFQTHLWLFQKQPYFSLADSIAGSTGGFSHLYNTPAYQLNVPGINTFNARNYLSSLGQPIFNQPLLHGRNWGRNYPDVAAGADQLKGYYFYRKVKHGFAWDDGDGTSIASPQYAAVAALINSQSGRPRMGFWNPQIYQLAQTKDSPFTPLNDTINNSNLYYTGQPGTVYNQATGLGIPNFSKLAAEYK